MKTREMARFENELQAQMARLNGTPGDWRKTAIAETRTSILTDPLNSRYWRGSFDQVRHFPISDDRPRRASAAIRSLEKIASRQSTRSHKGRRVAFDRTARSLFREYLPDRNERVHEARARLERELGNRQRTSKTWSEWVRLQSYLSRFRGNSRVSDLDVSVVTPALQALHSNQI